MSALGLLSLFAPGAGLAPERIYDLLSTRNNLGRRSLYLNLGYWDGAQDYDAACEALADLLADAAGLGPGLELLDAGFGFADQDLRWAATRGLQRIVGVNITASQVVAARRRVAEAGLSDRVSLLNASATCLPFPGSSFDRVTALETAFHYQRREDFFREAFRVLRPGGRLALADIIPLKERSAYSLVDRVGEWIGLRFWQIPRDNLYRLPGYLSRLERAGFRNCTARSIRDKVYGPFARFALRRLDEPDVVERMDPLIRAFWKLSARGMAGRHGGIDYVIVTGEKPHA